MEGYLGEFPCEIPNTCFADFTKTDWALYFVEKYGQFDGAHHKAWVLDQVARILNDAPITVVQARWKNGITEYRVSVDSSERYEKWVEEMRGSLELDEDGEPEYEYDYDEGIPP